MRAIIRLLAVLVLGLVPTLPAGGDTVTCGDTVTEDLTLPHDLDCGEEDAIALEVGADGVTIDLGGHEVWGTIHVPGFDHVTITNGSFAIGGVAVEEADGTWISEIHHAFEDAGIRLSDSRHSVIVRSSSAVELVRSHHTSIALLEVPAKQVDHIRLVDSSHNVVVANRVTSGFRSGISLVGSSHHNVVAHNEVGPFDDHPIHLEGHHNQVFGNVVQESGPEGWSIVDEGRSNRVAENTVLPQER